MVLQTPIMAVFLFAMSGAVLYYLRDKSRGEVDVGNAKFIGPIWFLMLVMAGLLLTFGYLL